MGVGLGLVVGDGEGFGVPVGFPVGCGPAGVDVPGDGVGFGPAS